MVIASQDPTSFDADNGIIGIDNQVTAGSIQIGAAGTDDPLYPVINMANPDTYSYFQQLNAIQNISFVIRPDGVHNIDFVALAGHNLGTGKRSIVIYGALTVDGGGNPIGLTGLVGVNPSDDSPILLRFTNAPYKFLLITITAIAGSSGFARVAVVYAGKLLILERKLQLSFTPLPYGRNVQVVSGMSESGNFLGRIAINRTLTSSANFAFMTPAWFRQYMQPFLIAAETKPFFYAWAPVSYPTEVGYAWLTSSPRPEIHDAVELWRVTLQMQGYQP